ncbi:TPA: hypothetical protein VBN14_001776 [Streptococcus agalactiae]|nr:hypothetical protein [Streptococcus agalactiae]
MGGRGQKFFLKGKGKKISKDAIIKRNKLKNYLLNPTKSNGKSAIFTDLGYNMSNWKRLEKDIRSGLLQATKDDTLKLNRVNKKGEGIYNAEMSLGIGKKRKMVTGWIVKDTSGVLNFVTAFPSRK